MKIPKIKLQLCEIFWPMPYDILDKIPIAAKEFELTALTQIQMNFSINFANEKPLDTWGNPQCKCVFSAFRIKA
jgi:hypothetical protein